MAKRVCMYAPDKKEEVTVTVNVHVLSPGARAACLVKKEAGRFFRPQILGDSS